MIDHIGVHVSDYDAQQALLRGGARAARLRDGDGVRRGRAGLGAGGKPDFWISTGTGRPAPHRLRAPQSRATSTRSTARPSPPAAGTTAARACAPSTTPPTTAPSCSTPTATTSRPSATGRSSDHARRPLQRGARSRRPRRRARRSGRSCSAAQFVDVLWALFVLVGIEQLRIDPSLPSNPLDLYDMPWTHSLVGALFWARRRLRRCARRLALERRSRRRWRVTVASHWLLDLLVHRPDLPLWPGSAKLGLGIWNYPVPALLLELGAAARLRVDPRAGAWRGAAGSGSSWARSP